LFQLYLSFSLRTSGVPFVSHERYRILFPCTIQILLKLLLATVDPRRVVFFGDSHALVPE